MKEDKKKTMRKVQYNRLLKDPSFKIYIIRGKRREI